MIASSQTPPRLQIHSDKYKYGHGGSGPPPTGSRVTECSLTRLTRLTLNRNASHTHALVRLDVRHASSTEQACSLDCGLTLI